MLLTPSRLRLPLVGLALAAAVALPSCGSEASAQEVVVGTPEATLGAGSASIYEEVTIVGGPAAVPKTTFEGEMDFGTGQGALTGEIAGAELELVIDGTIIYEKLPGLAEEIGTPWLKIDLDDAAELAGIEGFGDLTQAQSNDPSSTLAYLRGAGDVTEVGEEDVRGEPTTHYRAVTDLRRAAEGLEEAQAKTLRQTAEVMGTSEVPVDVWVDDEGRTRRMVQTIDYSKADIPNVPREQLPDSMTILIEYFDFGTPVSVNLPDDSDVTDIMELVER